MRALTDWFVALPEHLWSPHFLLALFVVSPKILSTGASFALRRLFDKKIKAATAAYQSCLRRLSDLEIATQAFEQFHLLRGSFLCTLSAVGAETELGRHVDGLYRHSALGALRRIAAEVYPDGWRDKVRQVEAILATNYDQAAKAEMQAIENEADDAARKLLTRLQGELHDISDGRATLEARRSRWSSGLDSAGTILTILAFVLDKS